MKRKRHVVNTRKAHRTNGNGYTLCGIKIIEFMDVINDEGFLIPPSKNQYQFTPYKSSIEVCKKCILPF
jgi:hypothetical protein